MNPEKEIGNKSKLHPRNKNRENYDLALLSELDAELKKYVKPNKYGTDSINFANPKTVKLLNKALLKSNYKIDFWEFPDENLCPPIPGRADYLHYIADLLAENNDGKIPEGEKIKCLDIGTGASCIYPIIGIGEYNWNFIATDIDEKALQSCQNIVDKNSLLKDKIELRFQKNLNHIFTGIINEKDKIDVSICNPPFHESKEAALKSNQRKVTNLSGKYDKNFNFSGNSNELIYEGGEIQFIENMIRESSIYSKNIMWFSTLVSKQSNLHKIDQYLNKAKAAEIRIIEMGTGNKSSRVVAWTFLTKRARKDW